MLHLDARVHLDEIKLAVLIHQEFDGPGVDVADFGERLAEHGRQSRAQFRRHLRGGRLFQQFLMPPLNGALALAQAHNVSVLVGQNLKLDVPRMFDEFFHVKVAVAEGRRASD